MTLFETLTLPANLYWAWEKVRRYYRTMDGWYNELDVARFELHLEKELKGIAADFRRGRYRLSPLRPLPLPKRQDADGVPQTRQAFWVSVRDQVAWITYVNVVGPSLDSLMPPWSYGNRLFRTVWVDDSEGRSKVHIGRYRNTSGQIYRHFRQSWPLYRRHVFLTIRRMAAAAGARELADLGPAETRVLEAEAEDLPQDMRLPYLKPDYWVQRVEQPHWVSLDLERFYPSINIEGIITNFEAVFHDEPDLAGPLLNGLLRFTVDSSGFEAGQLESMGLSPTIRTFPHIPTGLMAAGFLANVAMLRVDRTVQEQVQQRQIAHFRYVDDHVILAPSFDALESWVRSYRDLLQESGAGASFNEDKFEPKEIGTYFKSGADSDESRAAAARKCRLDSRFPSPLMTQTLAKVSDVTRCDVELLDEQEQQALLADLEHLMLAEFPATELPPATRVAFAAARIARIAAEKQRSVRDLTEHERCVVALDEEIAGATRKGLDSSALVESLEKERREHWRLLRRYQKIERHDRRRTLQLLLKALQEFPEKVRLWQHVVSFCRRSGLADFEAILAEVQRLHQKNPLAAGFVRASLLQILARQALAATRTVCDADDLPQRRRVSLLCLKGILRQSVFGPLSQGSAYYEDVSKLVFAAAAGVAAALISHRAQAAGIAEKRVAALKKQATALGAVDWSAPCEDWPVATDYPPVVWIWWAESASQPALATEPGRIWELAARNCAVTDPDSWNLWRLYPAHLPEPAQTALASGAVKLQASERGWWFETPLAAGRAKLLAPAGEGHGEERFDLLRWSDWVMERRDQNPFDPRVGEWTCLEIAGQVLELSKKESRAAGTIHPANFTIPSIWTQGAVTPTWETWKRTARTNTITAARKNVVRDRRLVSGWSGEAVLEELDKIAAVALVLLGLLRRGFRWPAVWNPVGQRAAWADLARALIRRTPCSSWTASILDGCLLSRQRESLILEMLFPTMASGEDDTTDDPPSFSSLNKLGKAIGVAQRTLEYYQISVQNHEPRQMVPISLTQLSRQTWADELEEDE